VLHISGQDRRTFLQGLVSNDINLVSTGTAIYAGLLTPQGKFLHDLFVIEDGDRLLLDCETDRAPDLIKRLNAHKLRGKVAIEDQSNTYDIWAIWPAPIHLGPLAFADPRLPALGARAIVKSGETPHPAPHGHISDYEQLRLEHGIGDGSRDLQIEKSTLIEGNFDLLHGISWSKGCYMGQELTARMHYRGLAKKRLFPVHIESGEPLAPNMPIHFEGADIGDMRSRHEDAGLALLSIEATRRAIAEETPMTCGETRLWPRWPDWMRIER
jgi:folate-binding protein YgfZ